MIDTILFDLDGTLLEIDTDAFIEKYFKSIVVKFAKMQRDSDVILKGIISGTKAMLKNNGDALNEVKFWEGFTTATNIKRDEIENDFEDFYRNEFVALKKDARINKNMVKATSLLVEKGYKLYLTTNPLFPKEAVEERLRWAGIHVSIFEDVTSYENCKACKPNIKYYEEVIVNNNLDVQKCMMVGNDVIEDGIIEQLNVPLYLVKDCLINKNEEELTCKWNGYSQDFLSFVEALETIK